MEPNLLQKKINKNNIRRFQSDSGESVNQSVEFDFLEYEAEGEYEEEEDDYDEEEFDTTQIIINQIYETLLPLIIKDWIICPSYECEDMETMDESMSKVKVIFKNGNVYEGYIQDSRFHGQGTFIWADGARYDGNFYKNYARGFGKFLNPEGDIYLGMFSRGVSSHGISDLQTNHFTYNGFFLNGHFHGKGFLKAPPLYEFTGEFAVDMPLRGVRRYNSGTFIGDYDNIGFRKYGKYIFNNSDCYNGHWLDDAYNDFGVYIWANINPIYDYPLITYKETLYSGFWVEGNRNGVGLIKFDDILIVSKWKFDQKDGPALLRAANGQIFISNCMFKRNQYNDGWSLKINDDEVINTIKNILDLPSKFDGRNICHLKDIISEEYMQCKNIFKNYISQLLLKTDCQTVFTPYFISNYQMSKDLVIFEYIESIAKKVQYISMEIELKCLRQVIQDNYHLINLIYIKYAIFDRSITESELTSTGHYCMNRLGLWLFYNDTFSNIPKINKMDNIEICDKYYHLLPKDPLDYKEPIYFWEFLRHIIHIIVILNQTNCTIYEQALNERESIFGLFGTMFLIFLREFSVIHKKQTSLSWKMILECPMIIQSLLLKIYKIKSELNIREAYKFFLNIKNVRDKRIKGNTIYILQNVTDQNFIQCCSKIYPNMVKDDFLLSTCFNITPLEFCEIIFLCFEKEIWNQKYLDQYTDM